MARTVSDTRPPLARIASYGVGAGGLTTSLVSAANCTVEGEEEQINFRR